MKNYLFLKTKDKETAYYLLKNEYNLIDYSNSIWTFENKTPTTAVFDNNKVCYTNILAI